MKKTIYIINKILLLLNIILFIYFIIYTILGTYPLGNYISSDDINFQLVLSLIFEFTSIFITTLLSLIIKIDLSYKGKEILNFISTPLLFFIIIATMLTIIYSIAIKINIKFIIMIIVMSTFILLESGITRMFKNTI